MAEQTSTANLTDWQTQSRPTGLTTRSASRSSKWFAAPCWRAIRGRSFGAERNRADLRPSDPIPTMLPSW